MNVYISPHPLLIYLRAIALDFIVIPLNCSSSRLSMYLIFKMERTCKNEFFVVKYYLSSLTFRYNTIASNE